MRAQGHIVVDESAAGTQVRLPVILVNGAHDGPTLLVASGVHGDDLNTVPMVWRIASDVDVDELHGQLIAVPVINPLAFEAGSHLTPTDNMSPVFPGDEAGTISQRIGHHVYTKLLSQADYVIDMHGGSKNATLATLAHIDGGSEPEIYARTEAMAIAFGPQLIVVQDAKPDQPPRGMAQVSSRRGAPGIYVGMGRMGFNEEDTARGAEGVFNVMRHLGMLPGEPAAPATPPAMTRTELYQTTPYGGGFFPAVAAGEEVETGALLGTVFNMFGQPCGEIRAEAAGIVDAIRSYPVVAAGDWIVSIARWRE